MNTKTMDGLIGARMNIEMMNVPIRVFKEARLKNDYATMERSMDYAGQFSEKAWEYEAKADEGMKEEAKEEREKAKERAREELAAKIEEKKEQRKAEAEAFLEKQTESNGETGNAVETGSDKENGRQKEAPEGGPDMEAEPGMEPVRAEMPNKKPVLYSSTGEAKTAPEQGLGINVSVTL